VTSEGAREGEVKNLPCSAYYLGKWGPISSENREERRSGQQVTDKLKQAVRVQEREKILKLENAQLRGATGGRRG